MSGFKEIVKSVDIRYKKNSWHQVHTTQTNYSLLVLRLACPVHHGVLWPCPSNKNPLFQKLHAWRNAETETHEQKNQPEYQEYQQASVPTISNMACKD